MTTRYYKQLKLLYDLDFNNRQVLAKWRLYKVTEDESITTPITPLHQVRNLDNLKGISEEIDLAIELATELVQKTNFKARYVEAIITNPFNKSGVSEFKVVIPYRPLDPFHKAHIREVLDLSNVECGRYQGETHETLPKFL